MTPEAHLGGRPRLQRAIVFVSILAVAMVAALVAGPGRNGSAARAALPDGPYSCGASDQNRQPVKMWDGTMTSDGNNASMTPCLSGVALTLDIPDQSGAATISSIRKLDDNQNVAIKTADGSTIPGVYHLGFKGFTINGSATGVTLSTTSGTATPHTLTLAPDNGAIFGGGDVVTDLLVDGDSSITIQNMPFYVPIILDTCALLGGSGGSTCTVKVKDISSGLVQLANAIGTSSFTIRKMSLKIYYIVTHTTAGGSPSGAAFQFPNTSITVGGS